jgi:hypothetical protein
MTSSQYVARSRKPMRAATGHGVAATAEGGGGAGSGSSAVDDRAASASMLFAAAVLMSETLPTAQARVERRTAPG